jgi:hypothetical protein
MGLAKVRVLTCFVKGEAPPSSIHFALEIEQVDVEAAKNVLIQNKIPIEKEMSWGGGGKSIYLRDPVGNLVEIVTKGQWPVED